jgi:hypothetical protein
MSAKESVFCAKCASETEEGNTFCRFCGRRLLGDSPERDKAAEACKTVPSLHEMVREEVLDNFENGDDNLPRFCEDCGEELVTKEELEAS